MRRAWVRNLAVVLGALLLVSVALLMAAVVLAGVA